MGEAAVSQEAELPPGIWVDAYPNPHSRPAAGGGRSASRAGTGGEGGPLWGRVPYGLVLHPTAGSHLPAQLWALCRRVGILVPVVESSRAAGRIAQMNCDYISSH